MIQSTKEPIQYLLKTYIVASLFSVLENTMKGIQILSISEVAREFDDLK